LNLESSVESTVVALCDESHAFFHYFERTRRVTTRLLKIAKEIPDIQHIRHPRYDSTEYSRLTQGILAHHKVLLNFRVKGYDD
jgi:hypothetical protein